MFSKTLFSTLTIIALASGTFAAPALSCPAVSSAAATSVAATTSLAASSSVLASSSSVLASSSSVVTSSSIAAVTTSGAKDIATSIATTSAAAATTSSASSSSSKNGANFGRCPAPEIKFATGLDGRREAAFAPVDTRDFPHGSADSISVITSFICQRLQTTCRANKAAVSECQTATQAANKAAKGGAQADAFNKVFGITTNFANTGSSGNNAAAGGKGGNQTVNQGGSKGGQSNNQGGNKGNQSNNQGGSKGGNGGAASSAVSTSSVASATASVTASAVNSASDAASSTVSDSASSTADAASATSAASNNEDQQEALTLNPAVLATGFEQDGQATPAAGQVASLTSKNNFINFCLTVNKPITNGQQITTGSCNPAPIGVIASTANMPSSKFTFPKNFGSLKANTPFTITMAVNNLETGNFVNAQTNYYAAPQQVNAQGNIIGHTHVVIEQLDSLNSTTALDPSKFAFFKGVNGAAVDGVVSADVTAGLPAGSYRLASINAAANHQPVLVAVAQHGSLDDMVYFTVN